jgi:4-alpha-glucanotransferase
VRDQVLTYLGRDGNDIAWDFIRLTLTSQSLISIFPMQDVLRLGDEGRMNTPGRADGNWSWRMRWTELEPGLADGLSRLSHLTARTPLSPRPESFDPSDYTQSDAAHPLREAIVN